ncbi:hypothetical protein GFC01_10830 [Desulfofundulus thermobenzoicus]|uniref:Uncharacterized protein n=1 Tax=Desulfofundulus thermobenzoicus TaxID=29376 RepID=A0A6N7IUG2_9FIRM|nr:hypothetical protein [Desulfofundulus thermobenzoicus]MQL52748.1 hypothetical protein [Desulfofundulus thermobenzoicus]
MSKKFMETLLYFRERYWAWILGDEMPAEFPVYALYTIFWLIIAGSALRNYANHLEPMEATVLISVLMFTVLISSFYFAPAWFASLWIIPAIPSALVVSLIYAINSLIFKKENCWDFLTKEELVGGYLDFSSFGGDSGGHNKMG